MTEILFYNETEILRDVTYPGVKPGMYKVSSTGRLYSVKKEKFMKTSISNVGYKIVKLRGVNGLVYTTLHRIVAWEFCLFHSDIRNIVNHIDGDRMNNSSMNLEWVSFRDNMKHAFINGLVTGESLDIDAEVRIKPNKPFNEKNIRRWCELLEKGYSKTDIVLMEGYKNTTEGILFYNGLTHLISGRSYKKITKDYNLTKGSLNNKLYKDEDIHMVCRMLSEGATSTMVYNALDGNHTLKKIQALVYHIRKGTSHKEISSLYGLH